RQAQRREQDRPGERQPESPHECRVLQDRDVVLRLPDVREELEGRGDDIVAGLEAGDRHPGQRQQGGQHDDGGGEVSQHRPGRAGTAGGPAATPGRHSSGGGGDGVRAERLDRGLSGESHQPSTAFSELMSRKMTAERPPRTRKSSSAAAIEYPGYRSLVNRWKMSRFGSRVDWVGPPSVITSGSSYCWIVATKVVTSR